MFSYHLIWPIIQLASSNLLDVIFETGEILLDASEEDFKADGRVTFNGIELLLLETSGAFGIRDNNRFSQDHVKGAFGVLTFLRKILKTVCFATEDTMQQLRVLFVHARGKQFISFQIF